MALKHLAFFPKQVCLLNAELIINMGVIGIKGFRWRRRRLAIKFGNKKIRLDSNCGRNSFCKLSKMAENVVIIQQIELFGLSKFCYLYLKISEIIPVWII